MDGCAVGGRDHETTAQDTGRSDGEDKVGEVANCLAGAAVGVVWQWSDAVSLTIAVNMDSTQVYSVGGSGACAGSGLRLRSWRQRRARRRSVVQPSQMLCSCNSGLKVWGEPERSAIGVGRVN